MTIEAVNRHFTIKKDIRLVTSTGYSLCFQIICLYYLRIGLESSIL